MSLFDISITVPAGTYVLGDPCYSIDGKTDDGVDRWQEWLERAGSGSILVAEIPGSEHVAIAFSTAYGDGYWPVRESGVKTDTMVGADAGLLGLVPAEYIRENHVIFGNDTKVVTFDKPTKCSMKDDGTLVFGRYSVKTGV